MEPGKVKFKWLVSLITSVLILITIALHFTLLIPGPDAGIFMYGGKLISIGKLPYIDLWDNKPPIVYYIASVGYLYKNNPFLAVRIIEILCYLVDLYLIRSITQITDRGKPDKYLLIFSACYLLFWEGGFLTEVFVLPLCLAICYLYFSNHKIFLQAGALIWWGVFLLKPNAVVVPTILLASYFFSKDHKIKNLLCFLFPFFATAIAAYIWLLYTGMLTGFIENVFMYNIQYAKRGSITNTIIKQFSTPSYFVYLFTFIISAYYYYKNNRTKEAKHVIATFILCYVAAFINGKNHEHYALLTILPATYIISYCTDRFVIPLVLSAALIITALHSGSVLFNKYNRSLTAKTTLANEIKKRTKPTETIYYAGKHGAYLYILSNRFSSSKLITPFSEVHAANSRYGKMIIKELSEKHATLLLIPKESINSRSIYYSTIKAQLYNYQPIDTIENIVIYQFHAKQQ